MLDRAKDIYEPPSREIASETVGKAIWLIVISNIRNIVVAMIVTLTKRPAGKTFSFCW